MHYCKVCNSEIPEKRVALGYITTCVNHSNTFRYSGTIVADDKATTWIQVVKNPETAKHINSLNRSRGKV